MVQRCSSVSADQRLDTNLTYARVKLHDLLQKIRLYTYARPKTSFARLVKCFAKSFAKFSLHKKCFAEVLTIFAKAFTNIEKLSTFFVSLLETFENAPTYFSNEQKSFVGHG